MLILNGGKAPSHGIINSFRKHVLGESIEILFYELVKFLEMVGEINFENAFVDGTKLEANAGKYTYIWRKNVEQTW
jgi:transposase